MPEMTAEKRAGLTARLDNVDDYLKACRTVLEANGNPELCRKIVALIESEVSDA